MPFKKSLLLISALIVLSNFSPVLALPEGESVVAGSVSFDRSTANTLNIATPSEKAIVDYNSFNIAANEKVNFAQPSSSSVILNRVTGQDPSAIYGQINANGKVFLVNPNGVLFGAGSKVDCAALVASTLDITNENFLKGNYEFYKVAGKNGFIVNQGTLTTRQPGGYICLLSQSVDNQGIVVAELGTVAMAAGEKMTVSLDDNNLISVAVDEAVKESLIGPDGQKITSAVKNSGSIIANGGKVLLTAKALNGIFDYAVNNTGIIQAQNLISHDGVVELVAQGAPVINIGKIEAGQVNISVKDAGFINKGEIITDGYVPELANGGRISIEAATILQQGKISANAYEGGTAGQINIISDNSTVLDEGSSTQARAMGLAGNGGRVIINATGGNTTVNRNATIDVSAGAVSGDAGFIEISAYRQVGFFGILTGRAPPTGKTAKVLFDPYILTGDINTPAFDVDILQNDGIIIHANILGLNVNIDADYDNDGIGSLILSPDKTIASVNNITLRATNFYVYGTINAGNSLTMSTCADAGLDLVIDADIAVAGTLKITDACGIQINANITVNSGDLIITATGNLVLSAGNTIQTVTSGNLELTGAKLQLLGTVNSAGNLTTTGTPVNGSSVNSINALIGSIGTVGGTITLNMPAAAYAEAVDATRVNILNFTGTSGTVTLNGLTTALGSSVSSTRNMNINGNTSLGGSLNMNNRNLTVIADSIDFLGGADSITGTGTVTLQPTASGVSIGIGNGTGTLIIDSTDLAAICASLDLTIGRSGGTHAIIIDNAAFNSVTGIRSAGAGGSITIEGVNNFNNSVTLSSVIDNNGSIVLNGTTLTITSNSIDLGAAGSISGTGTVVIQPTSDSVSIDIGNIAGGTLLVSQSNLDAIAPELAITIGRSGGKHTIIINAATFNNVTIVRSTGTGGSITLQASNTLNAAVTLNGPVDNTGTIVLNGVTLTISFNSITGLGAANSISGTGTVVIQPTADNTSIGIAGALGTLQVTQAFLDAISPTLSITIGRSGGRHAIIINAVTFNNSVTVRAPNGGSITVDGQINATGSASITLDGSGATTILNADIITAGGAINIDDNVILGTPVSITLSSSGGTITIAGTINDDFADTTTLVVNAATGDVFLQNTIGGTTQISGLDVGGKNITVDDIGDSNTVGVAGITGLNALNQITFIGSTYKANQQSYNAGSAANSLIIQNNTTFTSSDDPITFTGTINGTSNDDLTINAVSGAVTVGIIGSGSQINTVSITGSTIALNGDITTSDAANNTVTLSGNVMLDSDITINTNAASNDGAVNITGTIDSVTGGFKALNIDTGTADITIAGAIGVTDALGSLELSGDDISIANIGGAGAGVTGDTSITAITSGGTITFTGTIYNANQQTYNAGAAANTIRLRSDTIFTSSDYAISFTGTINGTSDDDLTIDAGAGIVTVGIIGSTNEIRDISIDAGVINLNGLIKGTGDVTITSTGAGNNITLSFNITGGTVTINSAADVLDDGVQTTRIISNDITLNAAGDIGYFDVSSEINAKATIQWLVDVELLSGGTVTAIAGGNIYISEVADGSLNISDYDFTTGAGNIIALANLNSSGGSIIVDTPIISSANPLFLWATNDITVNAGITLQKAHDMLALAAYGDINQNANIQTNAGDIYIAADFNDNGSGTYYLNSSNYVDSTDGLGGSAGIDIKAASVNINTTGTALINAGTSKVIIRPSNSRPININSTNPSSSLNLTPAEINKITAGILVIGDSTSGNITISQSIAPVGTSTLSLITSGTITETGSATITVDDLALRSAGTITLNNNNDVGTIAARISGAGDFSYTDINGITIGTVDGITGIVLDNGIITLTLGGPIVHNSGLLYDFDCIDLFLNTSGAIGTSLEPILTHSSNLKIAASGDVWIINDGALVLTNFGSGDSGTITAGSLNLTVNSPLTISANVNVAGDITLAAGNDAASAGDTLTISADITSSVAGSTITLNAGDSIDHTAGTVSVTGGGTINATANAEGDVSDGDPATFTQAAGAVFNSNNGDITVNSFGDATINLLDAGLGIVNVTANNGIIKNSVSGVNCIIGATLNLVGNLGIGTAITSPLEVIAVTALNADSSLNNSNSYINSSADMPVGTITAGSGDVYLASDGSILDDANNLTKITANNLSLEAANAIGVSGLTGQLDTSINTLIAATANNGCIYLFNDKTMSITAATALGAGSDIEIGADSDLTVGLIAAPDQVALTSVNGSIIDSTPADTVNVTCAKLTASASSGIDLDLNVDNLQAEATGTGDILFDELDGLTIDGLTTNNGSITVNTLGDMMVDGTITAGNSTVQLNLAAFNKTLSLADGALVQAAGAIQYIADRMVLGLASATVTDTLNHEVFLQPYTNGRLIKLGEADADDALGLASAELNTITARGLIIGDSAQLSGDISFGGIGAFNFTSSPILAVITAGSVTQSMPLTASKLVIIAAGPVTLDNPGNDVDELAASIGGAASAFNFVDSDDLTIAALGSLDLGSTAYGIQTSDGPVSIITSGFLAVNDCANPDTSVADIDAGSSTIELNSGTGTLALNTGSSVEALGGITYIADDMNLNGTSVTSTTDTSVYFCLKPFTAGWAIDLGTNTLGKLSLTDAEIDRITARKINIGSADAGQITISSAITKSGNPVAIRLITAEGVDDNSGVGSIGRPSSGSHNLYLAIEAVGPVSLTNSSNRITNLAAKITGLGNSFTYVDRDGLVITAVDGINGVSTNNGPISITAAKAASGDLTVNNISSYNNEIDAGDSTVLLSVNRLNDTLTLNSGSNVIGRGGVTYICDKIDLKSSSKTDAGSSAVNIRQYTNNRPINLGATNNPNGSLNVSDAELDTIYAGELRIGDSNSGNITLSNQISPAHIGSIYLITGAAIVDNHDGIDVVVPSMDLTAVTGINIDTRSTSIIATTTGGDIDIDNTNPSPVTANTTTTGGNILFSQTGGGSLTMQASATGNVGIDVTAGDLIIDKITAGLANAVTLETTGAILAGTPPTGPPLVTALTLDMTAGTGIGTAIDPITAQISELYAEVTGTGSIYLELDELVLDNGINLNTVTTFDGDIDITANATTRAIDAEAEGDVSITTNSATVHNLYAGTVYGNVVTLTANFGSILDLLEYDSSLAGSDIRANELHLGAADSIGSSSYPIYASVDDVYAQSAGSGNIYLTLDTNNYGYINLNSVTTAGDIFNDANSGDLYLGTITGNDVDLEALAGSILALLDGSGANISDITCNNLTLAANNGNIGDTTNSLLTDINNLYAYAGGSININDSASLTLVDVQGGLAGPLDVTILAEKDIAVGYVADPVRVTLTSSNGAVITGDKGANAYNAVTGELIINAVNGVGSSTELLTNIDDLTIINTGSGDINIREADDLNINNIRNDGGDVTVYSTSGSIHVDTITASGEGVTTVNGNWNPSGGQSYTSPNNPHYNLYSTGGTVQIWLNSSIDTYLYVLNSSGTCIASDDDSGSGLNSYISMYLAAGNYEVVAANYSGARYASFTLSVSGAGRLNSSGTGTVTLNAAGQIADLNGSGANNITSENLIATGANGIDLDTDIDTLTANSTNSDITIREANDLYVDTVNAGSGDVYLTAGGFVRNAPSTGKIYADYLSITADSIGTLNDYLNTDVNTLYTDTSAADGHIYVSEANDLYIDEIYAGSGDVYLSAGGFIRNLPGATTIHADALDLLAVTGIGTADDPLQTDVNSIIAETTADDSDIYINENNAVTLESIIAGSSGLYGDVNIENGSGDIVLGNIIGDNVYITADSGDIVDDTDASTLVTANYAEFNAPNGNIGATSDDADTDVDAATISANALLDIGIEAQSGTFFDGVTSDNGAVVLLSNGTTYLRDITAADDVVITNITGDLVFRGKVESIDSGVTVTSQQGSIATEVAGPHIAAKLDSYINVPNGTITLGGTPLDVSVADGYLIMDIGGKIGLNSGILTSPNLVPDEVFFIPSSYPSPLYPKGNVWLNGARIWPSASSFANSQALLQLLSKAALPDAQEFLRFLINSLDPRGLLFYHPLSPFDAAAFAALQFGAESYILSGNTLNLNGHDGLLPIFDQIKKKRKITI